MKITKLVGIALFATMPVAMVQGDETKTTGVILLNPQPQEKVEHLVEVTGRVMSPGYPVVLVRADQPGCLWWAQERPMKTSQRSFKASAQIGNENSLDGSRFQIVVLMVPTAEGRELFEPGASFRDLPPDLARSVETVVVLKKPDGILGKPKRTLTKLESVPEVTPEDSEAEHPKLIHSPIENSQVERADLVTCSSLDGRKPIVLVRSTQANDSWWVQAACSQVGKNRFVSSARFGNDSTATGTRFQIVAIYPDAAQATNLRAGMAIDHLPADVARSAEVEVVRLNSSQVAMMNVGAE
ncbi:hypothetical protein [Novipirellula caenicola]|uniref:Secreted protein n=1 Tax=Novipirellula caenicola TaxID=1536901 RepID=A0ABP9VQ59_9BACT